MKFQEEEEKYKLMKMVKIEDDNRESNHLVSKNFFVAKLKHLLEYFNRNKNDPEKNNHLVNIIKSGLKDLNNEINGMSEEERENERVDKIIEIFERILAYIKQQQKQEGQGLKILTLSQMLSRLPISLAQLEAGNNSKKTKKRNKAIIIFSLLFKKYNQASMQ